MDLKGQLCFIIAVSAAIAICFGGVGSTGAYYGDGEKSSADQFRGWTSTAWTQTTQADFNAGVLNNTETSSSPGNVGLSTRSDWYNTQWACRKAITFTSNATKIPSTQANFPVLISLSVDSNLAASAQDDGDDILFTASDGVSKLDHEIEYFDGGTGQLQAWVRVPSLSTSALVYLYYNNSICSSQQNAAGVWDTSYKGVWHLTEDAAGEVHLETLRPNAPGDETGIASQYPNSTQHWDKVDEATPDDHGTDVYTTSMSYQRDLYALPNHTASGTINSVTVYFRFYSPGFFTQTKAKAAIKTNGIVYEGVEHSTTSGWESDSQIWTTNPNTGSRWTWGEVDALQAGISLRTTDWNDAASCTQVYVEVDYSLYEDSTSNDNDGKDLVSSSSKVGQIGRGQGFDGADDWIDLGDSVSLQVTTVTVEAWCKPSVTGVYMGIGGKLQDAFDKGFGLSKADTNKFRFQTATGGISTTIDSNSAYTDTNWHYVVGVRSGGVNYLFVDGVQQTQTSTASIADSEMVAHIGRQYVDYDSRYWNGSIDEFRISASGRSANWIMTCYSNQSSPATFYTLGAVEGTRSPAGTVASQVRDTTVAGSRWDAMCWDRTLQSGTAITFEVRASDTLFAKEAVTPSWVSVGTSSPVTSGLPSGRYKQWRATLTTSDTSNTPVLHEARVYHN
jgi:hypothetical protein